ncbi:MAG: DUF541 domain-containing protein [Spirochaetia bacterium]|nr:DUF541 domain-containing protein [Spirochaetia bacterium]
MKRAVKMLLVVALIVSLGLITSCKTTQDLVRTIEVSATGNAVLTPDIASFSIQVSEKGETTGEAQARANAKMHELFSVLEKNGVEEKDIRNTMINLRPNYTWIEGKQILDGQVASQSVYVTLRDLSLLGPVIDQMGKVSGIYLNSVTLDKEDKSEGIETAKIRAIESAMEKARLFAEKTGMQLGKPITISEYSTASNPYNTRMMKMEMASGMAYDMATEIPAGTMDVTATVSMVFEMY